MNNQTQDAVHLLAQRILDMGYEEIPARERHVIERIAKRLAVSRNVNIEHDKSYTRIRNSRSMSGRCCSATPRP